MHILIHTILATLALSTLAAPAGEGVPPLPANVGDLALSQTDPELRQAAAFRDVDAGIAKNADDVKAIGAFQDEARRRVAFANEISRLQKQRKAQIANGLVPPETINSAQVDRDIEALRAGAPMRRRSISDDVDGYVRSAFGWAGGL